MYGIIKLRAMVQGDPAMGWRERYGAHAHRRGPPPSSTTADDQEARRSTSSSRGETAGA